MVSSFRDQSGFDDPKVFFYDSEPKKLSQLALRGASVKSRDFLVLKVLSRSEERFQSGEDLVWLQERVKHVHWADLKLKFFSL